MTYTHISTPKGVNKMGYRSQVLIAVEKDVFDHQMSRGTVPECLVNAEHETLEELPSGIAGAVFWQLNEWKWYDSYPDVRAILTWFDLLDQEEELAVLIRPKIVSKHNKTQIYHDDQPPYGMVRIGEDKDDIEELGDPSYYDIEVHVEIVSPLDYS